MRRDSVCFNTSHGCESTLTRFVWSGDQLLWELRVPGGNDVSPGSSGLDATSASGAMYGRVSYFHAGGIDKPLLITKEGAESVVPRETWRGQCHASGLRSLARLLLTLAQDGVPQHHHIHLDESNALEDGSATLIIERM